MLAAILVGLLALGTLVTSIDCQEIAGVTTVPVFLPLELQKNDKSSVIYSNSRKGLLNNSASSGLPMPSTMAVLLIADQGEKETTTYFSPQETGQSTTISQNVSSNSIMREVHFTSHNDNDITSQLPLGLHETVASKMQQLLKQRRISEFRTEVIPHTSNTLNVQEIQPTTDINKMTINNSEGSLSPATEPFLLQTTNGTITDQLQEMGQTSNHSTIFSNVSDQLIVSLSQNMKQGVYYTTQTVFLSTPQVPVLEVQFNQSDKSTELIMEGVLRLSNTTSDLYQGIAREHSTAIRDLNQTLKFQYNVTGNTTDNQDGSNTEVSSNNTALNIQQKNELNVSCPPLEILDFLRNISTLNRTEMELEWPCEVRSFWLDIKSLATVVRFLFHRVAIVIIILGFLLNIISFCVLNTSPMSTCSVSVYLRALAIADIGVLLYNFTAVIRGDSKAFNAYYLDNTGLCIMDRILFVGSLYCSTWFVVALTLERLVMIIFPFNVHNWGTTRTATWTVGVIAALALSLAVLRTQVSGFEKETVYEYETCGTKSKYWSGYLYVFIAIGSWIPTTLILISNTYLMVQVRRSALHRSNLSAYKAEPDPNTLKMTRMLLLVSASYLISVLPLAIVAGTELYWKAELGTQPSNRLEYIKWKKHLMLFKWVRALFFFFYMLNFAGNFFLYYISGQKFRHAVKDTLQQWLSIVCCKRGDNKSKNTLKPNSNHKVLTLSGSNVSEDSKRRISDSSTISELVYYNSAYTHTETVTGEAVT